jgi:hypothetical protein
VRARDKIALQASHGSDALPIGRLSRPDRRSPPLGAATWPVQVGPGACIPGRMPPQSITGTPSLGIAIRQRKSREKRKARQQLSNHNLQQGAQSQRRKTTGQQSSQRSVGSAMRQCTTLTPRMHACQKQPHWRSVIAGEARRAPIGQQRIRGLQRLSKEQNSGDIESTMTTSPSSAHRM